LGALSQKRVSGFLVAGVNPRRALDEQYRDFFDLVAGQVTRAVANARIHEEERKRAEALAELDRAKTIFFSNVSHEFRTPLTLTLGPMEETLADPGTPPAIRERLEVSQRNARRLQKLVNSLLDFSRIEAGRIQAIYEPIALDALTADLASVFRSAVERAGMRLIVDCERLTEPVYVDREMWEKIVLNLVSNAFKYTFAGEIVVTLRQRDHAVEFSVRDTGIGIPKSELPRLFERFYRVEGARGRTHEGTGIGLALVQELVKLHGGAIDVTSTLGKGSAFTVRLALGRAHLPAEKIRAARAEAFSSAASAVYREEALHWLPDESLPGNADWVPATAETDSLNSPPSGTQGARIILADDNADMREYVRHLLAPYYRVESLPDGEAALAAARLARPDLVITDAMMPRMDGFQLLSAIRNSEALNAVPMIMLSARAGEEARLEGLAAGADAYLVKPFSARELLAHVGAQLALARLRRQADQSLHEKEERFRLVARASNDVIWEIDLEKERVWWSEAMQDVFGYASEDIGPDVSWYHEHIHPDDRDRVVKGLAGVIESEAQIWSDEFRYRRADGTYAHVIDRAYVARGATNRAVRIIGSMRDISERQRAEEKLRRSEEQLAGILRQASVGIAQVDTAGRFVLVNDRYCETVGRSREELLGLRMQDITHPDDVERNLALFQNTARTGEDFEIEKRYVRPDGSFVWVHNSVYALRSVPGRIEHLVAVSLDITERRQAQEHLEELKSLLETRVAERTGDLLRAIAERERLQDQLLQAQKMESVGTLASGVAHDFNNLLNIISSYAAIMRLDGKNPAAISEGVSVIDETVRRGAALVQQLMTLGRRSETRSEPVGLNSVAEKLANLLSETFSKAIAITLDLERGLPAIDGDENQLHQALLNLCVNARDAMPKGGRISLKTAQVSGEALRHRQPEAVAESYVLISVSDSGSGMDEATQRRIFEPFFTTKPVGEGSGLGLAVVYGIVKNHAGFIEVESRIGRGTTFCIHLPIPTATSEQNSGDGRNGKWSKPKGHGETILFVDDEERQLNIMRRFLESEGYKVLAARDGLEALETFKRHKEEIAVAVLDLGLPRLGGWPAFQQMREIRPALKVLVASGFVSAEVEAEMAQGKLVGIIAKPYQLDDVLEKISQAIHNSLVIH
jgi:PAS domain S-box-containing protein